MLDLPLLPEGYDFHHLGYATTSMKRERAIFQSLGYNQEGEIFSDPIQGVTGCFMTGPGPRIEFLENLPGSETLSPWIKTGIKLYHFAYWVDCIDSAINWARVQRAKVTVQPVPAVAFDERRICFLMFCNGLMLEFIEKTSNNRKL